jgi:hypothetical protein
VSNKAVPLEGVHCISGRKVTCGARATRSCHERAFFRPIFTGPPLAVRIPSFFTNLHWIEATVNANYGTIRC